MDSYACETCGHSAPKWFGRCPECGGWSVRMRSEAGRSDMEIVGLAGGEQPRWSSCDPEVDRVLGGGFVSSSAILLTGEPGIGKSTLALQILGRAVRSGRRGLFIAAEESCEQVGARAARIGAPAGALRAGSTRSLEALLDAADREDPEVIVVDSIQAVADERLDYAAGSPTQVRACASALVDLAKRTGAIVILVGHVTKEGAAAGPKALEHVMDVVLELQGERTGTLRLLRSCKNRFGACDETGVFVMEGDGLRAVADPSALLLGDRRAGLSGSVVFCSVEGSRPVLVEIQALVCPTQVAPPRRVAIGVETRRLAMLGGVLLKHASLNLTGCDVFVASVGGLAVSEPAADLPTALALWSAESGVPLPEGIVAVGEVGLGGEIRRVPSLPRRLAEAARLGFHTALVPVGVEHDDAQLQLVNVSDIARAIDAAREAANASRVEACYPL